MKNKVKANKKRKKKLTKAEKSIMSMTEIREYYELENVPTPSLNRRGRIENLTKMGKQPKNSKRINKKFLSNSSLREDFIRL